MNCLVLLLNVGLRTAPWKNPYKRVNAHFYFVLKLFFSIIGHTFQPKRKEDIKNKEIGSKDVEVYALVCHFSKIHEKRTNTSRLVIN